MIDGCYTDAEWCRIAETMSGTSRKADVRRCLEDAVRKYADEQLTIERMANAVKEREGWSEIENLTAQLARLMREREHVIAPVWGDDRDLAGLEQARRSDLLQQLDQINRIATENVWQYQSYVVGRANPNRDKLYAEIFGIWTELLGGKLEWSDEGPLVRFFQAALVPVLGEETPKSTSIRTIMKREIARRNATPPEIRRTAASRPKSAKRSSAVKRRARLKFAKSADIANRGPHRSRPAAT